MYNFPDQPLARIWDLPGAGTPKWPLTDYIRKVGLKIEAPKSQMDVSIAEWFFMEYPFHMDDLGVPPMTLETSILNTWANARMPPAPLFGGWVSAALQFRIPIAAALQDALQSLCHARYVLAASLRHGRLSRKLQRGILS